MRIIERNVVLPRNKPCNTKGPIRSTSSKRRVTAANVSNAMALLNCFLRAEGVPGRPTKRAEARLTVGVG